MSDRTIGASLASMEVRVSCAQLPTSTTTGAHLGSSPLGGPKPRKINHGSLLSGSKPCKMQCVRFLVGRKTCKIHSFDFWVFEKHI